MSRHTDLPRQPASPPPPPARPDKLTAAELARHLDRITPKDTTT